MKRIIIEIPEKLAAKYKFMCDISKSSMKSNLQTAIYWMISKWEEERPEEAEAFEKIWEVKQGIEK